MADISVTSISEEGYVTASRLGDFELTIDATKQEGHVALDSTFFERGRASSYYLQWLDRDVQTLKVTTLTDTESLAALDL